MPDEPDAPDTRDADQPAPDDRNFSERQHKTAVTLGRVVPHSRALGIRVISVSAAEAVYELPYDAKLVGNPDTGTVHGGAITALLDGCSGASVFAVLEHPVPIATLDLRIDYLKPAEPGQSVIAKATCYKLTRNVAFTRAVAYQTDPGDPVAHAVGTFMLSTKAGKP